MICVTIAQESQTLAAVDMVNAGGLCDLIELRLDKFIKPPEIKNLIEKCPKPIIISCRRTQDGGSFEGAESARLTLLRQAVLDGADYIEIEHDVADQVRRYGKTKRVIHYCNFAEIPDNLSEIYQEMVNMDPDVIKLTLPTKTPEQAWPLLRLLATSSTPVVPMCFGRNSLMVSILAQRYKAPWSYAALEKGMEAFPGQPTISELEEVCKHSEVDAKTPLIGIAGVSAGSMLIARVLNHGFKTANMKTRCLPIEVADVDRFVKIANSIKLSGLLVDDRNRDKVTTHLTEKEESVEQSGACDFIHIKQQTWKGYNTIYRAVRAGIEDTIKQKWGPETTLQGRSILIVGCSGTGRAVAHSLRKHGALVMVADRDEKKSQQVATEVGGRYVQAGLVYTTMCDGLVVCPGEAEPGIAITRGMARENQIACDLTNLPFATSFLDDAKAVGSVVVPPKAIFIRMMQTLLKACSGQAFTPEQVLAPLAEAGVEF